MKREAYHHGELRETLIALALQDLESGGPESLSVSALAKRAGVSPMAPYRHFADKDALIEALARRGFLALGERMRQASEPDARATLIAFGVAYVEFAVAQPGLFKLMFGRAPPTPDAEIAADPNSVFALFSARLGEIVKPAWREDAFLASWAMIHGLASLCAAGRIRGAQASPRELARRLGAMLIAAL